jgi:hypothetical protein
MPIQSRCLAKLSAVLLSACCFAAQAETFVLNLTGTVANATSSSFDWNGTHYDFWRIHHLTGLDTDTAITVKQGDFIDVTITLDAPVNVPSSETLTWYDVGFHGSSFPPGPSVTNNGTLDLKLAGVTVLSGTNTNCGTEGWLVNCKIFSAPENGPLTIDQAVFRFEITELSAPVTLDVASFGYSLHSPAAPVPEPVSSLMLGLGLGLLALRRRQSN